MMEGILVLFKNLLAVPDPKPSTSSGDAHKHRLQVISNTFQRFLSYFIPQDNFIIALFEENVFEFYMHLLQNINRSENKKFLHLMLETIYLLFHRDSPSDLVTAYQDALTSKVSSVSVHIRVINKVVVRLEQWSVCDPQNTSGAREKIQRAID